MLNINLTDFIELFNNHWCDWDGQFGNQCFDFAQFWNKVLGGSPFTGATADLIYNQPQNIYTQIPNTPDGVPQAGDIVVWNWPHVGVATGNNSNTNQFEVIEQNDPTDSSCHIKVYTNYDGVIGWLRPNQLPTDQQAVIDQLRTERDTNWNLYQTDEGKISTLNSTIDSLNQIIKDKQSKIDTLTSQNGDLTTSLGSKDSTIQTLQEQADKVVPLQTELAQALNDRQLCLNAQGDTNKLISNLKAQIAAGKPTTLWGRIKYVFNL